MSKAIELNVEVRPRIGKGGAREARRNGLVPGVLYGGGEDPVAITLKKNELVKAINSGKFRGNTVTLIHEGNKQLVIPQDIQFHPVSDQAQHVDLYRVKSDQIISIEVAVRFTNEEASPGLKKGGTLNIVRHTVELNVRADSIPEFLEANLDGLEVGDNVKISSIDLPDGAAPTIQDRDFTIATIAGRGGAVEKDADADAEGEDGEETEASDGDAE
ncbi:MAG: 50S ribosomal protein L25/general stress protein Ctc [Pseudomonadota bacterium]